jgi:hypothetical protein
VKRLTLERRIEALERQLTGPPPLAMLILRTATIEQLDEMENEIEVGGPFPVWDALVASYNSEVPGP